MFLGTVSTGVGIGVGSVAESNGVLDDTRLRDPLGMLAGDSGAMRSLRTLIRRIAVSDST